MTTLAASLSATDRVMQTVAALGFETNYPIPVLIDSECLIVTRQMARAGYQYQVLRAQNGTAPASHASGVSVTAYVGGGSGGVTATDGTTTVDPATSLSFAPGTITDLGGGVAGVALNIRQIGPFRVNWNDAQIDSGTGSGVLLATLPADALVIRAWAIPRTVWTYTGGPGDPILLILALNTDDDGPLLFYNAQIDSLFASAYNEGELGAEPYSATASYLAVATGANEANGPTTLRAFAQSTAALTAGSADVYAIIATPPS